MQHKNLQTSRIQVITGDTKTHYMINEFKKRGIGRVTTRGKFKPYEGEKWAFDNSAFTAWANCINWNADLYIKSLQQVMADKKPYFAVIPDKIMCEDSLAFSMAWLDKLCSGLIANIEGIDWYFCIQNTMSYGDVESIVKDERIKGLMLGGIVDDFRLTWDEQFCELAHSNGKKFHYAKTSNQKSILRAIQIGADSCDSSYFLYTYKLFTDFLTFYDKEIARENSDRENNSCC